MTPEQKAIRQLSDRLVAAQAPIRILDAIKWTDEIKQDFFKNKCKKLPAIDKDYYKQNPLPFNPEDKIAEFRSITRDAKNQLGQFSGVTRMIENRCEDYYKAIELIANRGTPEFTALSVELYGGPDDAFYLGGPRLFELGTLLEDVLKNLAEDVKSDADEKRYTAEEAMTILQQRLSMYFTHHNQVIVKLSDDIIADAAAGADSIKLNSNVRFSERDIRYLEVHEGWVHVGTTLNGAEQPYCTFLAKGSPASSVTQEGLAVITEIFAFTAYPSRILRLTNRVRATHLVSQGANFIDIFNFFKDQSCDDDESYNHCLRVFRGSTPTGGPFTKDLSYTKGFLLLYNYIRLAVQKGLIQQVPIFFVGKTLIEEIQNLSELVEQGLVVPPLYVPPQFRDLSALSAWMSFSLFLNKFDLTTLAKQYQFILHD